MHLHLAAESLPCFLEERLVLFGDIIGGRAGQLIPVCSCFIVDNLSLAFGYMKIEGGILPILGILLRGGGGQLVVGIF